LTKWLSAIKKKERKSKKLPQKREKKVLLLQKNNFGPNIDFWVKATKNYIHKGRHDIHHNDTRVSFTEQNATCQNDTH
jgi:hypothetical protein